MKSNDLADTPADATSRPEETATNTAEKEMDASASRTAEPVLQDEASRLRELDANIRDQDDLEREVGRQVRPHL